MTNKGDLSFRDQTVEIVVNALRDQGYPDLTLETVRSNPAHRDAFVEMLESCRPLPAIRQLIEDAKLSRL